MPNEVKLYPWPGDFASSLRLHFSEQNRMLVLGTTICFSQCALQMEITVSAVQKYRMRQDGCMAGAAKRKYRAHAESNFHAWLNSLITNGDNEPRTEREHMRSARRRSERKWERDEGVQ